MESVVRRAGQSEFRQRLLDAYGGRCAVTGCDVEEALQAAHIIPYLGEHSNETSNGILLRADVHNLFDSYVLSIDPDTSTVRIAPNLLKSSYATLEGSSPEWPHVHESRPAKAALRR